MPPLDKFNNFEFLGVTNFSIEPEVVAEMEAAVQETRTFEEVHFGDPNEVVMMEPEVSEEPEEEEQQEHQAEAPANPPPPHFPAGFLEDEGDDVLDAEDLYDLGLLNPPHSPPYFGFDEDLDDLDGPGPYEPMDQGSGPVFEFVPGAAFAIYSLEHLREYMKYLELLEAEEAGGPGVPQAPIASASGSLDNPPDDDHGDDYDIGDVD